MTLRFSDPTVVGVRRFITEISYAGRYVYGRKHRRRVEAGGEPMPAHRPVGQFVELEDHHEPYISYEEHQENLRILEMNRRTPKHSQLGKGSALIQGLCHCRRHGRALNIYWVERARRKHWGLRCKGDYFRGGDPCDQLPGPALEALVVQAALERLAPPIIDEARRIWTAGRRDWKRANAGIAVDVQRQEEYLDRLRRRILEDTGERAHLRDMLDDEYERAAHKLAALRQQATKQEDVPDPFTPARWDELVRLCVDRRAIWGAPTTTNQDRKHLLRILIHQVVIENVDTERIAASVEWADGAPASKVEVLRTPYFHRLIWTWHSEGIGVADMVGRLDRMGGTTQQGRRWSKPTVQRTLSTLFARARGSDEAGGVPAPSAKERAHRVMFALNATGSEAEEIAKRLNAAKLYTRFGNEWTPASVGRVLRESQSMRRAGRDD